MAITEVSFFRYGSGGGNAAGDRYATLIYQVISDDRYDGPLTILAADGLPRRGSTYYTSGEQDPWMFAKEATAELKEADKSRFVWLVTVPFSTVDSRDNEGHGRDPTEPKGDPLQERPRIWTTTTKTKRQMLTDVNGRVIASSAGEPYDPVQERDETKYLLHIQRNLPEANVLLNDSYRDAVNSDNFWGLPPKTVKVEEPGLIEKLYDGSGRVFFRESWTFAISNTSWRLKLKDVGFNKLNDAGDDYETILGSDGKPLSSAVFLDGAGQPLAVGDDPVDLPEFDLYEALPFRKLGLPESFYDR